MNISEEVVFKFISKISILSDIVKHCYVGIGRLKGKERISSRIRDHENEGWKQHVLVNLNGAKIAAMAEMITFYILQNKKKSEKKPLNIRNKETQLGQLSSTKGIKDDHSYQVYIMYSEDKKFALNNDYNAFYSEQKKQKASRNK